MDGILFCYCFNFFCPKYELFWKFFQIIDPAIFFLQFHIVMTKSISHLCQFIGVSFNLRLGRLIRFSHFVFLGFQGFHGIFFLLQSSQFLFEAWVDQPHVIERVHHAILKMIDFSDSCQGDLIPIFVPSPFIFLVGLEFFIQLLKQFDRDISSFQNTVYTQLLDLFLWGFGSSSPSSDEFLMSTHVSFLTILFLFELFSHDYASEFLIMTDSFLYVGQLFGFGVLRNEFVLLLNGHSGDSICLDASGFPLSFWNS